MPGPYSQYVFKYLHKGTQKEDSQTYEKVFTIIKKILAQPIHSNNHRSTFLLTLITIQLHYCTPSYSSLPFILQVVGAFITPIFIYCRESPARVSVACCHSLLFFYCGCHEKLKNETAVVCMRLTRVTRDEPLWQLATTIHHKSSSCCLVLFFNDSGWDLYICCFSHN